VEVELRSALRPWRSRNRLLASPADLRVAAAVYRYPGEGEMVAGGWPFAVLEAAATVGGNISRGRRARQ
jgi:hypothetical protein